MDVDLDNPFQSLLGQLFPFLLSLLDDALVLGLSHLGLHVHWLQWLSPIILSFTALYWAVQLWKHRHWFGKLLKRGNLSWGIEKFEGGDH